LRCGEPCLVRNDADESALQSTIRVALGRPAARGAGGGLARRWPLCARLRWSTC